MVMTITLGARPGPDLRGESLRRDCPARPGGHAAGTRWRSWAAATRVTGQAPGVDDGLCRRVPTGGLPVQQSADRIPAAISSSLRDWSYSSAAISRVYWPSLGATPARSGRVPQTATAGAAATRRCAPAPGKQASGSAGGPCSRNMVSTGAKGTSSAVSSFSHSRADFLANSARRSQPGRSSSRRAGCTCRSAGRRPSRPVSKYWANASIVSVLTASMSEVSTCRPAVIL